MKRSVLQTTLILCFSFLSFHSFAQNVSINSSGNAPDNSAMLDVSATDKGILIPRMDSTSRKNIVSPAEGLMVFDSTYNSFYFHDGTVWSAVGSDNLGDHIATQNVQLKNNWLNNNGGDFEGIQIDSNGYVGVNRSPQGPFQVSTGLASPTTLVAQLDIAGAAFELSQVPIWQSFTAPEDFYLTEFIVSISSGNDPFFVYSLYEGEGIGGTVLATGANIFNDFPFNDIPLVANKKYTISISLEVGSASTFLHSGVGDLYAGGMSSLSGNNDITFSVKGKGFKSGLLVNNTGVSFENYTFPNGDGSANQVLITDGSGALSWSLNPFSNYTLPAGNGSVGQVLTTDGTGLLNWGTNNTAVLEDADQNTKIQVEKNVNENIIRYDLNGIEKWVMQGSTFANRDTNLLIGKNAGLNVTTGERLTSLGNYALAANTTGYDNTSIGNNALSLNTTGYRNTAIGSGALKSFAAGRENVAIGMEAMGSTMGTGSFNTVMGAYAGWRITTGNSNTLLGYWAGRTVNNGSQNVIVGQYAGFQSNMSEATLVGYGAGGSGLATRTTAVGKEAGANTGNGGVYLGYRAGQNEVGENKLYIDNSNSSTPLIWGDFASDILKVHGTFNINDAFSFPIADGTTGQQLQTDGSGQLSWVDKTANTPQTLNINGNDSLFISGANGVDLAPYKDADDLGNHTATQSLILGTNAIQNNSSSANGLSMGPQNQLLVESNFQRSGFFTTTGVNLFGQSFGNYIEVNNKFGTRAIFGANGHGLSSVTDTLDAVIGNFTAGGGLTFHINAGIKAMTLDAFGRLGIGRIATTNLLEVEGNASKSTAGDWLANSDARLKKNITPLSSNDILDKMLSLQGVTYEWDDTQTGTKRPEGIQYGFTAQNIQEVFPTLVTEDNLGFLQTPYGTYDAMTVEAIRALNDKIKTLQHQVQQLQGENETYSSTLEEVLSRLTKLEKVSTEAAANETAK